jgi:hypothetical protein
MAMRKIKTRDEPWRGSVTVWAKLMLAFRNGTEADLPKKLHVSRSRLRHLAHFYHMSRRPWPVRKQLELFPPKED